MPRWAAGVGGEYIRVYVRLSRFAVHLKLSQHYYWLYPIKGFPGGSDGKESACSAETWVPSLSWEDPLEESMATYSSILAWRIPKDRRAWRATVHGVTKSWGHD